MPPTVLPVGKAVLVITTVAEATVSATAPTGVLSTSVMVMSVSAIDTAAPRTKNSFT